MKTYKLEEIFQFAVGVEEEGKRFYDEAAEQAQGKEAKELFVYLGKQEAKHAQKFLKFHAAYARKRASFQADGRLRELLETLMRGMIFPPMSQMKEALGDQDTRPLLPIIRLAMGVETHSILFYQEVNSLVSEAETKKAISQIVQEEENHLVKLKNLRMDLDPYYAASKYGRWL